MTTPVGKFYVESRRLGGEAPVSSSTIANWQTAEADVVSLGVAGRRYKVNSLLLDVATLIGTVTVRLYMQINGVERQVYTQNFTVAVDGAGLWIINGTIGIYDVLTVTVQSNNAADNGASVGYHYMLEAT